MARSTVRKGSKGSLLELKASNVPSMYQPLAKKIVNTQRQRHQQVRNAMIRDSAAEAMQVNVTRRTLKAPNLEFPAPTPGAYAAEKRRASHIRKWRKGKTQMPRELKWLTYRGPKLPPVGEEEDEGQVGGMPQAKRMRVSKTQNRPRSGRKTRGRSKKCN